MHFGWPYPKRLKFLQELAETKSGHTHGVRFQNKFQHMQIHRVPIELPKYRLKNGRTAAAQIEYLATHPKISPDIFSKDPESEEAQRIQHELLKQMVNDQGLFDYFKSGHEQELPFILTNTGFIVNGNRRVCAMRELLEEDRKQYERFSEPAQKLRSQIEDLISTYQPPWSAKMRHGRAETIPAMPSDVQQCFRESGLMDPWSPDVVKWWDSAAQMSRLRWSERLSHTGRLAEQLTCEYESNRTQTQPQWICLDSNFEGYDVLSQLSEHDTGKLLIEVKGSERRPKEADFSFTRNEYRTAHKSNNYVVHLWFVGEPKLLYVIPFQEISKHLPTDSGDGNWEITRIPFSSFGLFRAEL